MYFSLAFLLSGLAPMPFAQCHEPRVRASSKILLQLAVLSMPRHLLMVALRAARAHVLFDPLLVVLLGEKAAR